VVVVCIEQRVFAQAVDQGQDYEHSLHGTGPLLSNTVLVRQDIQSHTLLLSPYCSTQRCRAFLAAATDSLKRTYVA
jgi:hypothetical protein